MPRNKKGKGSKPGSPFDEQNGRFPTHSETDIGSKPVQAVRFSIAGSHDWGSGASASGTYNAQSLSSFSFKSGKKLGRNRTDLNSTAKNEYYLPPAGNPLRPVPSMGTLHRLDRQKIVLWKQPLRTLYYFLIELSLEVKEYSIKLWKCRNTVLMILITIAALYAGYLIPGPHQKVIQYLEKKLLWSAYWVGLGILSSVGLGTGLHTFLLYLGPHIASVTLAAYECDSLKFPEPPYPDEIMCPFDSTNSVGYAMNGNESVNAAATTMVSGLATSAVSLWAIMSKVRLEAFMWGAGTALGELPPYFMARAARLSGEEPDDEEYREFLEFLRAQRELEGVTRHQSWLDRAKVVMEKLVESVGFFGILICASIPNPLFDLAGITCGHFLVRFWTFFGATLIGKAVIKMHIQKLFVIMTFSEKHVEKMVNLIKYIPKIGPSLQAPFKEYLKQQKEKLHHRPGDPIKTKTSWLQMVFEIVVVVMITYFILSIISSLAQSYHKRLCNIEREKAKKKQL